MKQIKLLIILLALSTTLSAQWEQVDSIGSEYGSGHTLAVKGDYLYFIDTHSLHISDEGGINFTKIYETEFSDYIRIFNVEENNIFCSNDILLCASNNYGVSWDTIFQNDAYLFCIDTDDNEIFIGSDNKIHISYDNGTTWNEKLTPNNYFINSILKLSENTFLISCSNDLMIYKTTDNMQNWELVFSKEKDKDAMGITLGANFYKINNNEIIYTSFGNNESLILYSFDYGNTFEEIQDFTLLSAFKNINNQSVAVIKEEIGSWEFDYKLAVSPNYENWAVYDLPLEGVEDIAKFNDYLYAVDNLGRIYRTNLTNYVGLEEEQLNTKIDIFPNPTTSVLNIKSEDYIKKTSIYNSLGELVIQKTDFKNNQIDVSDLSSGVYILNIQTETESISEKIIIE